MKILIVILLFFPIVLLAQGKKESMSIEANFGIKGGLVLANLTPDPGSDYRLSYQLGVVGQFRLKGSHYLQTELLFSNEGEGDLKYGTALRNIILPILYKTDLNDWISLELGPQLTVNVSNNVWYGNTDNMVWLNADVGISAYVSKANYFNFRFSKGITPVFTEPNYFSSVFSLTLVNVF